MSVLVLTLAVSAGTTLRPVPARQPALLKHVPPSHYAGMSAAARKVGHPDIQLLLNTHHAFADFYRPFEVLFPG
jgi:hypothetical protein